MSSNGNLALVDGTGSASNYSLNSTVINISKRVQTSGSKTYDANTDALASAITLSNQRVQRRWLIVALHQ